MKKSLLSLVYIVLTAVTSTQAQAQNFQASVETQQVHQQGDTTLIGTVWLSHQGQINIVWDGVSLNAGKVVLPLSDYSQMFARFPTITFDLQKIFGADWMEAVQLSVNTATYDKDPAVRATTDTSIGTIALSLTQKIPTGEGWSWTVTESIGGTLNFKRVFHETGKVFEASPLNPSLNTQIVRKFSKNLALSIAMGTFLSVPRPQDGDKSGLMKGAYAAVGAQIGERFSTGLRVDRTHLLVPGVDSSGFKAINATAYVKYVLVKSSKFRHSIQAEFGTFNDAINTRANGQARKGKRLAVNYTLGW